MRELYEYNISRENVLKSMGHSVVFILDCQFDSKEVVHVNNIIKCNNRYKMISNGKFVFKDILGYLAQGTSLKSFSTA
jgi:hypothetical protein